MDANPLPDDTRQQLFAAQAAIQATPFTLVRLSSGFHVVFCASSNHPRRPLQGAQESMESN